MLTVSLIYYPCAYSIKFVYVLYSEYLDILMKLLPFQEDISYLCQGHKMGTSHRYFGQSLHASSLLIDHSKMKIIRE